jgi:hypothetical protein
MIVFRQKDFSILSSTVHGAGIGGTIGGLGTVFRPRKDADGEFMRKDKDGKPYFDENAKKSANNAYRLKFMATGMLVGAALGAIWGSIKEISKKANRAKTVDARIMEKVLRGLKASGLKEGVDFTRDPKQANAMKTKVCIVISKYSGELKLMINVVKDSKLEQTATQIVKNIPNTSNVVTRTGDRYNDIIVSTISDASADPGLICGIVENFVHSKYPVYLVEVG